MTGKALAAVICRELETLERELVAYHSDAEVWALPAGLPNSAGTLALHASGNLLHFVGTVLGGTGYLRDRDAEFGERGVPRSELVAGLRKAALVVSEVLGDLDQSVFAQPYPLPVLNRRQNTGEFMLHLATHLAYHAGQVDYHRRIVTGDAVGVGAVSPAALPSATVIDG